MTVTAASFVIERPEFATAGSALITKKIADAVLRVDEGEFGDAYDQAVSLTTAHLLWSSPFGVAMRLDGNGKEQAVSPYETEFRALRRERVPSILVT